MKHSLFSFLVLFCVLWTFTSAMPQEMPLPADTLQEKNQDNAASYLQISKISQEFIRDNPLEPNAPFNDKDHAVPSVLLHEDTFPLVPWSSVPTEEIQVSLGHFEMLLRPEYFPENWVNNTVAKRFFVEPLNKFNMGNQLSIDFIFARYDKNGVRFFLADSDNRIEIWAKLPKQVTLRTDGDFEVFAHQCLDKFIVFQNSDVEFEQVTSSPNFRGYFKKKQCFSWVLDKKFGFARNTTFSSDYIGFETDGNYIYFWTHDGNGFIKEKMEAEAKRKADNAQSVQSNSTVQRAVVWKSRFSDYPSRAKMGFPENMEKSAP